MPNTSNKKTDLFVGFNEKGKHCMAVRGYVFVNAQINRGPAALFAERMSADAALKNFIIFITYTLSFH